MKSLIILAVLLLAGTAAWASDGYTPPDASRAKLILEEKQVIPDDGAREIDIRTYKSPDGTFFRVYSMGGSVFRYDIDTNRVQPYELRLLDNDGDGVFETKERLVGEIKVGERTQRYFIDLGPEPGKEYRYAYERLLDRITRQPSPPAIHEEQEMLGNYPIYIPQWVIARF